MRPSRTVPPAQSSRMAQITQTDRFDGPGGPGEVLPAAAPVTEVSA